MMTATTLDDPFAEVLQKLKHSTSSLTDIDKPLQDVTTFLEDIDTVLGDVQDFPDVYGV